MSLKNRILETKEAWVDYPGLGNFKIKVGAISGIVARNLQMESHLFENHQLLA